MADRKTHFSIAGTNLALLTIILTVFSSSDYEGNEIYKVLLYTLTGLFLLNTALLIYYNQKEYLLELLSKKVSITDLLDDQKIKSEFYDKSYNIILLTIVIFIIIHHYVHDLLISTQLIKQGLLIIVYTLLVVFGFLLSKMGSLRMKILNEKLKYNKLSETFVCLEYNKSIEIHDKAGKNCTIRINYRLLAIKDSDGSDENKDKMGDIKFDGNLKLIGYFNCTPKLVEKNKYAFLPSKKVIKEGDIINFSVVCAGKDVFIKDSEYWYLNFERYTKNCTLEIIFPKGREIKNIACQPCDSSVNLHRETYKPVLFKKYDRYTAYYHIQDFSKIECYKIVWDW